jgi:CheY-like chemotaxis protein
MENRLLLQRLLEGAGLQVRIAENGKSGMEMFREWRPHLIWMDVRMPVMDGLEATRQIRMLEGGKSVRIVALTASAFKEERDNIMTA